MLQQPLSMILENYSSMKWTFFFMCDMILPDSFSKFLIPSIIYVLFVFFVIFWYFVLKIACSLFAILVMLWLCLTFSTFFLLLQKKTFATGLTYTLDKGRRVIRNEKKKFILGNISLYQQIKAKGIHIHIYPSSLDR